METVSNKLLTALYGGVDIEKQADCENLPGELDVESAPLSPRERLEALGKRELWQPGGLNEPLAGTVQKTETEFFTKSDARLEKVHEVAKDLFKNHPEELAAMMDEATKLRDASRADAINRAAQA